MGYLQFSAIYLLVGCGIDWNAAHVDAFSTEISGTVPCASRQQSQPRHGRIGNAAFGSTDRLQSRSHASSSVALNDVLAAVDTFYKTMPLASAFLTCGVKASAADIVAQKRHAFQEAKDAEEFSSDGDEERIISESIAIPLEKRRIFAFLLYGGMYTGMAQEILFNRFYPLLFGEGTDVITVASKVLFDSLIITPTLCLPVAYVVKSVIFQHSFKEAMSRYKNDVFTHGLLFKCWSLWGPAQCLTFGVIPRHLRIAFVAVVSFVWLVIFSSIAAKGKKGFDEECSLEDGLSCRIDG